MLCYSHSTVYYSHNTVYYSILQYSIVCVSQDQLKAECRICSLLFVSEADLNRHNHYKHLHMYNGTAEERTFLSSTSQVSGLDLTESVVRRLFGLRYVCI